MADVVARDTRFHYQRLGKANAERGTVVFLHGLVMDNLSSWFFTFANPVATFAEVLLYDLRGHGKSERRGDLSYSNELNGKTVIGLLDHAGVQKAHLVGNSLGGQVAAWVAIHYPDRVGKLILVDAAGARDFTWAAGIAPLVERGV